MKVEPARAEALFTAAAAIATQDEREAYLADACRGEPELRQRVEALLAAHLAPGSFLEPPARTDPPAEPTAEGPGSTVGRYRLLEKIGEGGFGTVYLAEQQHPVRRTVALKILRPGVETPQVISRFEHERQALALMDHPNIAKVLDAGTTESGRPYFVMELVKGVPITTYCDEQRLTPRQRLELFVQVCHAVQHAHQKAIIHRDLKPSNVLVALYDGKPVPKVIDFGVAKATGGPLSEHTACTGFGQMVGTLQYMSPEQAELNQLDVDTRSDIYSLGVLLYELLTGTTPIEGKRLKEAALLEALRLIREEEPPPPSTRLSTAEALPSISANRDMEPKKLARSLKGELDWIVMKCLEKDRTRRFETASGLAIDVLRHLNDEPVFARPAGRAYRLRKFVRRHRLGVTAGTAVALGLVLGTTGATVGMVRALKAKNAETRQLVETEAARSEAASVNAILQEILRSADPQIAMGKQVLVRDVLDRTANSLEQGALTSKPRTEAGIRHALGVTYAGLGMYRAAEVQLRRALEMRRTLLGERHPDIAQSICSLAAVRDQQGDPKEAESLTRQAMAMLRALRRDEHPLYAESLRRLATLMTERGELSAAEPLHREALALYRKVMGADHPETAGSLMNLGILLATKRDLAEAEASFRQALEIRRKTAGNSHPEVARCLHNLATVLSSTFALLSRRNGRS